MSAKGIANLAPAFAIGLPGCAKAFVGSPTPSLVPENGSASRTAISSPHAIVQRSISFQTSGMAMFGVAAAAAAAVAGKRQHKKELRLTRAVVSTSDQVSIEEKSDTAVADEIEQPTKNADLPVAVPFMGQPKYREFAENFVGDSGFDPLNVAKDLETLMTMRSAEIKHARLAMLAAAGWPLSEIFQPASGLPNMLSDEKLAPSVLNGGIDPLIQAFLLLSGGVAAAIDVLQPPGRPSGDYGFDPLNVKDFSPPVVSGMIPAGRNWMAEAEMKNGRLAMIAITAYVFQEFATKVPVVDETPFLFHSVL